MIIIIYTAYIMWYLFISSNFISSYHHIVYLMAQLAGEPVALEFVWTGILDHSATSPWATGPSSTRFGSSTWHWIRLGTKVGLNTASRTAWGPSDNRRYSVEVVSTTAQFRCPPSGHADRYPRILQSCILWHVQCNPIKSAGYEPLIGSPKDYNMCTICKCVYFCIMMWEYILSGRRNSTSILWSNCFTHSKQEL